MNFILFNVLLLAAGFLAFLIFSVGVMTCLAPLALFAKSESPPTALRVRWPLVVPVMGIAGIFQVYLWGLWAAFCVALTIHFTQKPEVTWDWVYWIQGFGGFAGLVGVAAPTGMIVWLAHKQESSWSAEDARAIRAGILLCSLVNILAFPIFSLNPSLMELPYGWALKPLGVVRADPLSSDAEIPPSEYVDQQYQFAFQFPTDWKIEKNLPPGEAGEIRVMVRHPAKPMLVSAVIGDTGKTFTERQFKSNPYRDALAEAMIEWTVEQVYKKASRGIGADRMLVSKRRVLESNAGVKFYISTAHTKGNVRMLMAGIHIIAFEKPYVVSS
jgi:hypothetical protein